MIRLEGEQIQALVQVGNQVRFVQLLKDWKDQELGLLPQRMQNVAVFQGRCQVLDELIKAIETAPDLMAKQRSP